MYAMFISIINNSRYLVNNGLSGETAQVEPAAI